MPICNLLINHFVFLCQWQTKYISTPKFGIAIPGLFRSGSCLMFNPWQRLNSPKGHQSKFLNGLTICTTVHNAILFNVSFFLRSTTTLGSGQIRQQLTCVRKQSRVHMQCQCVVVKFNCHVSTSPSLVLQTPRCPGAQPAPRSVMLRHVLLMSPLSRCPGFYPGTLGFIIFWGYSTHWDNAVGWGCALANGQGQVVRLGAKSLTEAKKRFAALRSKFIAPVFSVASRLRDKIPSFLQQVFQESIKQFRCRFPVANP